MCQLICGRELDIRLDSKGAIEAVLGQSQGVLPFDAVVVIKTRRVTILSGAVNATCLSISSGMATAPELQPPVCCCFPARLFWLGSMVTPTRPLPNGYVSEPGWVGKRQRVISRARSINCLMVMIRGIRRGLLGPQDVTRHGPQETGPRACKGAVTHLQAQRLNIPGNLATILVTRRSSRCGCHCPG